jgi:hypothetical protein
MRRTPATGILTVVAGLLLVTARAETTATSDQGQEGWLRRNLIDPQDGKLDASAFLESAYGFVPIGTVITDPALGYGGGLGLVFIQPNSDPATGKPIRPNMALAAAFATENGSWGGAAGHSGMWNGGRLKTLAGGFYASLNLEFFGVGELDLDRPLEYNLLAWGGIGQSDWRIGAGPFWAGLRYVYAEVTSEFDVGNMVPGIDPREYDETLSGLTPVLSYDSRDNIFTPTRGAYAEGSLAVFDDALGSSANFELASLTGIWYRPVGAALTFGIKTDVSASFGEVPFYLRPYVQLRGIQSLRLQGANMAQTEVELRWQPWGRISLVGFAGGGVVWPDLDELDNGRTTVTGGVGARYLLARLFGLHMGLDVAFGPDDPIIYFQFGSAWFRP